MNIDITDTRALAQHALECMLAQKPVIIKRGADWQRPPGFPLPQQKLAGPDQPYRPIAILEYVNDTLAASTRGEIMRDRHAESEDEL